MHECTQVQILRFLEKRSGEDKFPTSGLLALPELHTNEGCQAPYPQIKLRVT